MTYFVSKTDVCQLGIETLKVLSMTNSCSPFIYEHRTARRECYVDPQAYRPPSPLPLSAQSPSTCVTTRSTFIFSCLHADQRIADCCETILTVVPSVVKKGVDSLKIVLFDDFYFQAVGLAAGSLMADWLVTD